jgi:NADPH2:quinone reductase
MEQIATLFKAWHALSNYHTQETSNMVKSIIVRETGGPEKLILEDVEPGSPGEGQVRLRHEAIGLNFIDVYFRTGLYPAANGVPFTPGNEAAGIVTEVGPGVDHIKEGDRVAYVSPIGSYCEERLIPADNLVKVPDGIELDTAAAMMLKGMTAQYLLRQIGHVNENMTLLFHAAAGGVGLIAGQWAKHLGAKVIGTASTHDKIDLALEHGYDHVINYREKDFVEEVKALTDGKKCDIVYDSVGKDTFPDSLDCLRLRGHFVSFGNASGPVEAFNLGLLAQKGSLTVTRPTLASYTSTPEELQSTADDLFDVVKSGAVKIRINQTYALKDIQQAHKDLEARKTTGATIIKP